MSYEDETNAIYNSVTWTLDQARAELQKAEEDRYKTEALVKDMKQDADQMMAQARDLNERARRLLDEAHHLEDNTRQRLYKWLDVTGSLKRTKEHLDIIRRVSEKEEQP